MAFPLGQGSFVGIAQQSGPTGWGASVVNTGMKTFPNLGGTVLAPTAGFAPRKSISGSNPFAKGSQLYQTVSLVQVGWNFEVVTDDTAYKPLLLSAFGKRLNALVSGSDYTDTYTVTNPKFDAGTDGTPANTYYDHTLSVHTIISDGTTVVDKFSVKDFICTKFTWSGTANEATTMAFEGTGRTLAASGWSSPSFTDQSGDLLNWQDARSNTPAGLYMDTSSPPTTAWKIRKFTFTLNQPHSFEVGLGAANGLEMFTPFRTSPPTATVDFENFYEDNSGKDPLSHMADYIAGTRQGVIINYRRGIQDYMKLACHGSTDPAIVNSPKIDWGSQGAVTFAATLELFPEAVGDLFFELGTGSSA